MSENSRIEEELIQDIYSDGNLVKKTIVGGDTPITKRDDVTIKILITQGPSEILKDDNLMLSLEPEFVPQGLIDLMSSMKLHEKADVTVKSEFFKKNFSEHVPDILNDQDVNVSIEVKEVTKIEDIYGDGSFYLRYIDRTSESGLENNTRVRIHYKLEINKYSYLDNTEQVPLQISANDKRVPSMWIYAIQKMKQGEQVRIECNLSHEKIRFLDDGADPNYNISKHMPSDATVAFLYLKVFMFDTGLLTEGFSTIERSEAAMKLKEEGNGFFKAGNLEKAIEIYASALATLEPVSDDPALLKNSMAILLGNLTLCFIKSKKWTIAEEHATKMLEINTEDPKAMYRRGVARIGGHKYDAAMDDLKKSKEKAREINDNDLLQMIQKEINFINAEFKKENDAERHKFKNLFK